MVWLRHTEYAYYFCCKYRLGNLYPQGERFIGTVTAYGVCLLLLLQVQVRKPVPTRGAIHWYSYGIRSMLTTFAASTGWETCTHERTGSLVWLQHTKYAYYFCCKYRLGNLYPQGERFIGTVTAYGVCLLLLLQVQVRKPVPTRGAIHWYSYGIRSMPTTLLNSLLLTLDNFN